MPSCRLSSSSIFLFFEFVFFSTLVRCQGFFDCFSRIFTKKRKRTLSTRFLTDPPFNGYLILILILSFAIFFPLTLVLGGISIFVFVSVNLRFLSSFFLRLTRKRCVDAPTLAKRSVRRIVVVVVVVAGSEGSAVDDEIVLIWLSTLLVSDVFAPNTKWTIASLVVTMMMMIVIILSIL